MARTPIRYTTRARQMNKTRMFSITPADCRFDVFRGSGDGGQKRQKTSSGVRCTHDPSGAVGKATDAREQSQNRKNAFIRMTETPEFRAWMELEIDRRLGNVIVENNVNGDWIKEES
jgi:protein subunit release factor B